MRRVPREHVEIRSVPRRDAAASGAGFDRSERLHDIGGVDAFARLGERPLWINVHHAQRFDAGYRAFLQSYLDQLGARFVEMQPEVYEAGCFLLLSSGAASVHFHADPDQSFLNQIRGDKTVFTYPAAMLPQPVIEELAFTGDHAAVRHRPEYEGYAHPPVHLTAGRSVLLPLYAPHRVENGDSISVSLSVGFHTRKSHARSRAHLVARELRALGWPLDFAGKWSAVDRLVAPMHLGVRVRDAAARAIRRPSESAS